MGIASFCTSINAEMEKEHTYFQMSKWLMTHHAVELSRREPGIAAFSVNPGVANTTSEGLPNWLIKFVKSASYPEEMLNLFPPFFKRWLHVCSTNLAGVESCPAQFDQSAGVI